MRTFSLIDERLVEDTLFLKRTLGTPALKRREPCIPNCEAFGGVFRDPTTGIFRAWYSRPTARDPKVDVVGMDSIQCYAESRDGLHFEFPKLGLVEEKGSKDNNIVISHHQRDRNGRYLTGYGGVAGFSILDAALTPHPAARARYTALYHASFTDTYGGIGLCYSDDGLRWTAYDENPVIPGSQDTQNCLLYDPALGRYVCYMRPTIHTGYESHANRKIARCESADLIHWTPSRVCLDTDERDAPAHNAFDEPGMGGYVRGRDKQFQGIAPFLYNGLYIAHTWFYDVIEAWFADELIHSSDGIDWKREPQREFFVANGRPAGFDHKLLVPMASPPVPVGDELYFYTSGTPYNHHEIAANEFSKDRSKINAMLERWDCYAMALKRDRWIGYEAPVPGTQGFAQDREAELLTTPFDWEGGSALCLNANIEPGGYLKVEFEDRWARPIRDLHLDEILPIEGPVDGVDIPVLFGPGPKSIVKLPPVGPVRLRLRMKRATLYGFSVGGPHPELNDRDRWG
ncbi:hypothetical protein HQ590_02670 [bacterium]|nr:hypothetical protein [bacterium]